MYYLKKWSNIYNITIYNFKNGSLTTMMPDTCTLNKRISQKRIN